MTFFDIIAVLVTVAAIFAFLNERFIDLPRTIGLMAMSLLFSLALLALGKTGYFSLTDHAGEMLAKLDFYTILMHGMLGFLLFAGALHVNFDDLLSEKASILLLSTVPGNHNSLNNTSGTRRPLRLMYTKRVLSLFFSLITVYILPV